MFEGVVRDTEPSARGLRLGRVDGVVPGRGRHPGGRPRTIGLGHLHGPPGHDPRRAHRRGCLRSLPPVRAGPRPDGRGGPHRLPLLHRLAAHPAHRQGRGQHQGPGLLRPPGRRPAVSRHRTRPDPLPLGPPASPRGRGRLAEPRHGAPLRRVRRDRGRPARRPRPYVDHAQRTVHPYGLGLRPGHPRAGPHPVPGLPAGRPPPAARPRPGAAGAARPRPAGDDLQQLHPGLARLQHPCRPRRRAGLRQPAQPPLQRPDPQRHVPRPDGLRRGRHP